MRPTAKNGDYWKERMTALENEQYQRSAVYYRDVQEQYRRAANDIQMDIQIWYQRLADNNNISYAGAKRLLKRGELEEFRWTVDRYIKAGEENALNQNWIKQLENASARYHISYLEAMRLQIQQHAELLSTEFEGGITDFLSRTYREQYYHTAYEAARGTGIGIGITRLDHRKIETIIKKPWAQDGENFSGRIWANKEKLVSNLHSELAQNIIRGASPKEAIDRLSQTMNVSRSRAGRLIMTESAAVSSAAQKDVLKEMGVEKYEILATLDSHTSEICQELDGKIFDMKDYEVGVTAPPFHPNCRSTTVPYFDDEFTAEEMRAARDGSGKTYSVPADMDYATWSKKYIKKGLSARDRVFDGIPEHDKPIKLEKVDFSDKAMVISKLREYEHKIVDSPIENAIVISRDGIMKQCFGDLNGVYPDSDLGKGLVGACVTHNHPVGSANEYSFSKADINLFMDNNLEILRGIDEKYIYELTRNPEDIDEHVSIFELGEDDARHSAVIIEAEKLGIGYRRRLRE